MQILPPFDREHLWFWAVIAVVAILAPELWK